MSQKFQSEIKGQTKHNGQTEINIESKKEPVQQKGDDAEKRYNDPSKLHLDTDTDVDELGREGFLDALASSCRIPGRQSR